MAMILWANPHRRAAFLPADVDWNREGIANKRKSIKTRLSLVLAVALGATRALAQGTIIISPVPVTNGVTGTLADSSIVAALYFGPVGAPESALQLLQPPSALVNGFARFDLPTTIPGIAPGTSAELNVRAWSFGFPSYETAIASGSPAVLAGKSVLFAVLLGGSPGPPPVPNPLVFPGFTVYAVPEVSTASLMFVGLTLSLICRVRQVPTPIPARRMFSGLISSCATHKSPSGESAAEATANLPGRILPRR